MAVKGELVNRQNRYADARSQKSTLLASTREDRRQLESQLVALQAENARVQAAVRAAAQRASVSRGGGSVTAGPIRPASGGLVWPVNGPLTSPFGMRWGRLHAGIDIGAPEGTPIRAARAGSVILAGPQGAYGNYTCVQHGGGLSTCYAHQSSVSTSVGADVTQGEVIGAVGNTGRSSGAHLHFETRINGSPVDPAGYL